MKRLPKLLLLVLFSTLFATKVVAQEIPVFPGNVNKQKTDVNAYVHYDMDHDGMPNWWELFYGFDPTDPLDAALDSDNDMLTNLEEYMYGTNPLKKDTDKGGVNDYWEVIVGTDPLDPKDDYKVLELVKGMQPLEPPSGFRQDSDGDGIPDVTERLLGTNMYDPDTDGDGVNDYDEVYVYRTDPLNTDTDFDGISDGLEIFTYGTNPLARDTDFDGLTDYEELFVYGTDPKLWDTDDGGMSDYDEIQNGSDPLFKEDDYQFIWQVYYGEQQNDLFKSLEKNKIDVYEGLDLTLEARKPLEARSFTVRFNGKGFTTEKELIKLKILNPDDPGLYLLELILELESGKEIRMTRYVEVKRRGVIIRRAQGIFNNIYSKFKYFEPTIVADASIQVYLFNNITEQLEPYSSELFNIPNPQYTDSKGAYVLALHPGNYLIRIHKSRFGTKDILYNTDDYALYSQTTYLTYNYDFVIWGMIFIAVFMVTWFFLNILTYIRYLINESIEKRLTKGKYT